MVLYYTNGKGVINLKIESASALPDIWISTETTWESTSLASLLCGIKRWL